MPTVWNRRGPSVPKDAAYVGRPTKWGNPFRIGQNYQGRILTREDAVSAFDDWFRYSDQGRKLQEDLEELRGKDLECWCTQLPCYASVLFQMANTS